jgi:hypothetical protein
MTTNLRRAVNRGRHRAQCDCWEYTFVRCPDCARPVCRNCRDGGSKQCNRCAVLRRDPRAIGRPR